MDPLAEPDEWCRLYLGAPEPGDRADSEEALSAPEQTVVAVAGFLRSVHRHRVPPSAGAPDVSATTLLDVAERRCRRDRVDVEGFDAPYRGRTPEQLLDTARRLIPSEPASTLVLGATGLAHFDLRDGRVVGWRAGVRAGVGDPAMDVSWTARDISETFGPAFVVAFAEAYGEASPGPQRAEFWITLGQLL